MNEPTLQDALFRSYQCNRSKEDQEQLELGHGLLRYHGYSLSKSNTNGTSVQCDQIWRFGKYLKVIGQFIGRGI